ncbi:carboxypeptidase-like regulatory domain-containing protein [Dysgonomonas massiliensis]|uniref:carboxypeptidase-like regulatory domain-containing protein n=1 Tax=Dysgonomonas massiliensis TaxID=2040292 RepID=UPI000C778475|nr:carboxypeptidase-like regulatory domain-containing protein [Dysgonomonas massiliensis]
MNKGLTLIVILLSVLIAISCKNSKLRDHYSGFVVDEAGAPISGVLVREYFSIENSDTTDNLGYFKIKRIDNTLEDLIFSKKGYRTDTVRTVWLMHGEKEIYSDLITSNSSKWVMRAIVYRDSILNWSDKLRIYKNDSIEMRRDERLMYTQYLNRPKGEVIYRYYNYDGAPEREVYNINMEVGQIHFRDFYRHDSKGVENIGYLSAADSIPRPSNEDWSKYKYISVIKKVRNGLLLSETYISWESLEDCVVGRNEEYVIRKDYYKDNSYQIKKNTSDGTIYWHYFPNEQLHSHGAYKSLYGGIFQLLTSLTIP